MTVLSLNPDAGSDIQAHRPAEQPCPAVANEAVQSLAEQLI